MLFKSLFILKRERERKIVKKKRKRKKERFSVRFVCWVIFDLFFEWHNRFFFRVLLVNLVPRLVRNIGKDKTSTHHNTTLLPNNTTTQKNTTQPQRITTRHNNMMLFQKWGMRLLHEHAWVDIGWYLSCKKCLIFSILQ